MTPLSILLVLISALIHSSWNFFTKRGNFPVEFFFWVSLWGVIFYLPFFISFEILPSLFFKAPIELWWKVILSGIFEAVYFICLIKAYQVGDLSLIYPISRSAPLFTQVWAVLFIGEVFSETGFIGIGLVMLGLFVISLKEFRLRPSSTAFSHLNIRPFLLALSAALASSIYSVIDKAAVEMIHPIYYLWLINLSMSFFIGIYLLFGKEFSLRKVWEQSKKEILLVSLLQNAAYLLVLMAMTTSKVSYVVAFRQAGALFGALMGILLLKEAQWKTRITGALILTLGLILIGSVK
ncbi:MAG: hypothetical protein FJ130_05310 [Deltaproteobacteria bacterium]|nr:hypothetical protein [Deltaproteobacteria bacterium]